MKPRILGWRPNWLLVAFSLTVAYALVLVFVLLPATAPCENGSGLLGKVLACRNSNELGDLLSGAFAPVAFLWLVAAVLIQAQELKAQRDELALTRQELADSRDVMKEHAEQARNQAIQAQRQADFIGEQTANLKQQSEDHFREIQDNTFKEALNALHKGALGRLSKVSYRVPTAGGEINGGFADYRNMEPERAIHELREQLGGLDASLSSMDPSAKIKLPTAAFVALADGFEKLIPMKSTLSLSYQIKFDALGIVDIYEFATAVVHKIQATNAESGR